MVFIEHLRGEPPRGTTTVSPILCLMNWNDEQCRQFKSYIPKFASNFDAPRQAAAPAPPPAYDYDDQADEQPKKKNENDHGIADRSMNDVSAETTGVCFGVEKGIPVSKISFFRIPIKIFNSHFRILLTSPTNCRGYPTEHKTQ